MTTPAYRIMISRRDGQAVVRLLDAGGMQIGKTSLPADRLDAGCVTEVEIYDDRPAPGATTRIRAVDPAPPIPSRRPLFRGEVPDRSGPDDEPA